MLTFSDLTLYDSDLSSSDNNSVAIHFNPVKRHFSFCNVVQSIITLLRKNRKRYDKECKNAKWKIDWNGSSSDWKDMLKFIDKSSWSVSESGLLSNTSNINLMQKASLKAPFRFHTGSSCSTFWGNLAVQNDMSSSCKGSPPGKTKNPLTLSCCRQRQSSIFSHCCDDRIINFFHSIAEVDPLNGHLPAEKNIALQSNVSSCSISRHHTELRDLCPTPHKSNQHKHVHFQQHLHHQPHVDVTQQHISNYHPNRSLGGICKSVNRYLFDKKCSCFEEENCIGKSAERERLHSPEIYFRRLHESVSDVIPDVDNIHEEHVYLSAENAEYENNRRLGKVGKKTVRFHLGEPEDYISKHCCSSESRHLERQPCQFASLCSNSGSTASILGGSETDEDHDSVLRYSMKMPYRDCMDSKNFIKQQTSQPCGLPKHKIGMLSHFLDSISHVPPVCECPENGIYSCDLPRIKPYHTSLSPHFLSSQKCKLNTDNVSWRGSDCIKAQRCHHSSFSSVSLDASE